MWVCLYTLITPLKLALTASWLSVPLMVLHVCETSPLLQAGSLSVLEREERSDCRDLCSFPVPSCRVSRDVLTFSNASFVSRIATQTHTQTHRYIKHIRNCSDNNTTASFLFSIEKLILETVSNITLQRWHKTRSQGHKVCLKGKRRGWVYFTMGFVAISEDRESVESVEKLIKLTSIVNYLKK